MTHDRRRFIGMGLAGAAALATGCMTREDRSESRPAAGDAPIPAGKGPIVLSTWNHGLAANARALAVMAQGTVLDAVEQGVMVVEADLGNRSVGLGGWRDRDGKVTLDACIMDHDGRAGAVAFVQRYMHPIAIARAVMERTPHVLLVGAGAERWAAENGFSTSDADVEETRLAWREWLAKGEYKPVANIENHDTIGLVAMGEDGKLAGSCTTSGLAYKVHGRVGDSPIIGAGLFVDGDVGAACATGLGELVLRTAGSHTVVELMRHGRSPEEACREAVDRIRRKNPGLKDQQVGFLALRRDGAYGGWSLMEGFEYALSVDGTTSLVRPGFEYTWPG
jgi:isoaspartyl peptidase/L-asparaginase-like protein (Ntn-hydrolase superfamily)